MYILNAVPLGINGIAALHDYWFNVDNPNLPQTFWNNLWTMPAAAAITYPAYIGNLVVGWDSDPMAINTLLDSSNKR